MSTTDLDRFMKNQNFTVEELKLITNYAVNEVAKKENIVVDFKPLTTKEYFESDFFYEQLKVAKGYKKIDLFLAPYKKYAFCFRNTIIVFVDRFNTEDIHKKNYNLVDILFSAFHELAHVIQREKSDKFGAYENFILCMEDLLIKSNYMHYIKFFDKYWIEAYADLYAINRVEEFISNYPSHHYKNRNYINRVRDDKILTFGTYDFNYIFGKFHKLREKEIFLNSSNPISKYLYEKDSDKFVDISKIKKVFEQSKDNLILYLILSSDVFLKQLNFNTLTEDEIDLLIKAVSFAYLNERQKEIAAKKHHDKYDSINIFCPEILVNINYRISKLEEISEFLENKKRRLSLMKIKKKPTPNNSK